MIVYQSSTEKYLSALPFFSLTNNIAMSSVYNVFALLCKRIPTNGLLGRAGTEYETEIEKSDKRWSSVLEKMG